METVKITSKGQITIPHSASVALKALEDFQNSMKGEAEKAGFNDPDDVVKYIKRLRKTRNN